MIIINKIIAIYLIFKELVSLIEHAIPDFDGKDIIFRITEACSSLAMTPESDGNNRSLEIVLEVAGSVHNLPVTVATSETLLLPLIKHWLSTVSTQRRRRTSCTRSGASCQGFSSLGWCGLHCLSTLDSGVGC